MNIPEGGTRGEGTQAPQPKRALNAIFIASISIMLLVLSIGGFLFLQMSKGRDAVTAGAETATPTPTSSDIYMDTPPPQAVFYDTFINNALGWSISNTAGYYRMVEHGRLTLTNTNPGTTLIESLPSNAKYDNFTLSVDLTVLKAGRDDSAGIYIRGDGNMDHDYRIDLNGDNTFDIAKEYLDSKNNPQTAFLDGPRSSSALNHPGAQNTITVIMEGPQLQLFINDVKASTVTDSDYRTGQVALFVHTGEDSNRITVSYSRVEVDESSASNTKNVVRGEG